eukprot:8606188-Heterocapsa_arctica.AAC.1
MTENKKDTEWVDCNARVGAWRICRNPVCYRCDVIDTAELEVMKPIEKGPPVRTERLELLRLGVIRLTAEEAKDIISEQLHFG